MLRGHFQKPQMSVKVDGSTIGRGKPYGRANASFQISGDQDWGSGKKEGVAAANVVHSCLAALLCFLTALKLS